MEWRVDGMLPERLAASMHGGAKAETVRQVEYNRMEERPNG